MPVPVRQSPWQCYAMQCYAMLCYAMLCYAMLCYAMLCYAMLCSAVQCRRAPRTDRWALWSESAFAQAGRPTWCSAVYPVWSSRLKSWNHHSARASQRRMLRCCGPEAPQRHSVRRRCSAVLGWGGVGWGGVRTVMTALFWQLRHLNSLKRCACAVPQRRSAQCTAVPCAKAVPHRLRERTIRRIPT